MMQEMMQVTMLMQAMMQAMGDGGVCVKFWLGKTHVMFITPFPNIKND
jgi:hypothetical protein